MTFKPLHISSHLYFITATLLGWRPLFARREFALIVLNSLDWHRSQKRFALYAYVIMPTHFHAIVKPAKSQTISDNLQSLGSFTAHSVLKHLQDSGFSEELHYFAEQRQPDRTEKHQIWQPLQAKNIFSPEFLREKLDYIHNNPVAKKWQLAPDRVAYDYSSARFYDLGQQPIVPVDDVRIWLV
jgi:putative transposase